MDDTSSYFSSLYYLAISPHGMMFLENTFLFHHVFFCISDPDITAAIEIWKEPIFNLTQEVVGTSAVFLDGTRPYCRNYECNMGQSWAVDPEVEFWWPEIPEIDS